MPREVRVRAHYAVRLVTVAVADKKYTCLGHQMPPFAAICRVSKTLRRSEFCSYYPHDIFITAKSKHNEAKCVKSGQ